MLLKYVLSIHSILQIYGLKNKLPNILNNIKLTTYYFINKAKNKTFANNLKRPFTKVFIGLSVIIAFQNCCYLVRNADRIGINGAKIVI